MQKVINWFIKYKSKIIIAAISVMLLSLGLLLDSPQNTNTEKTKKDVINTATVSSADTVAVPENNTENHEIVTSSSKNTSAKNHTQSVNSGKTEKDPPVTTSNVNQTDKTSKPTTSIKTSKTTVSAESTAKEDATSSISEQDNYHTDPIPEGKPKPVEPENTTVTNKVYQCTISISCSTILNNMEKCDPDKRNIVPKDGWILMPTKVNFNEGESVFDVLKRVCKENKIHMEFSWTPMYNSAYIEGIYNLYEFDVGELSGWMYKVDEWFPNYGCSRYQLKDGQVIDWVYTCNLGYDVGEGFEQ